MDFYKIPGTVRASFSFYNTIEEIDLMIKERKSHNDVTIIINFNYDSN